MKRYFNTGIESCSNAHWSSKEQKILMVDSEFGSTIMSNRIYTSKKVKEVVVHRMAPKEMPAFPLESDILLLRERDSVITALIDLKRFDDIELERVSNLFYVGKDEKPVRIPNTREEMAYSSGIPAEDKLVIYKMAMESFSNFESLSKSTQVMFLSVFGSRSAVKEYLKNFGRTQYFFPRCPFSEVSRILVQGNKKIEIKITEKEYLKNTKTKERSTSPRNTKAAAETSINKTVPSNDSSTSHLSPRLPSNFESASIQYNNVLLVRFPISSVCSKYSYTLEKSTMHSFHVCLYGLNYVYIWSSKPLPCDCLRRVGISRFNILFHCEFTTNRENAHKNLQTDGQESEQRDN